MGETEHHISRICLAQGDLPTLHSRYIHCVQEKTPILILAHNFGKC